MNFQGTPRNVKQEQQVMGLSSFPVLPRPPTGPPAKQRLLQFLETFGALEEMITSCRVRAKSFATIVQL
jgi:hypothetical protein